MTQEVAPRKRRQWRPVLWTGLGLLMEQAQMDRAALAAHLGVTERTIAGWLWCRYYPTLSQTLRIVDLFAQVLPVGVNRILVILLAELPRVALDEQQRRTLASERAEISEMAP